MAGAEELAGKEEEAGTEEVVVAEAIDEDDRSAEVPGAAKAILILCMLMGRLELMTVLVLFVPGFWRK